MPQNSLAHMMLALKVLTARYGIGDAKIDPVDVETLKSYVGHEANGLADDQIACMVIEREVKKLRASGASA